MSDVALDTRHLASVPESAPQPISRGDGARTLAVELAIFAALAAFASAQWARLVSDPPVARLGLAVAAVTAIAAALGALRLRPGAPRLGAGLLALALFCAALIAVGLPVRMLAPGNWGELQEGIATGLAGIEDVEMPYDGPDAWVRLTLMLGAGAALALAAVLAFWTSRRRALGRFAALAMLLVLYGTAVTLDSPGAEVLWGVPLVVLAGAWLWAPGLSGARAGAAIAILLAAGALALPFAAALDSERPWWDYEGWDWFGRDRAVSFEWNHSYGPLAWPTEGTTLLEVTSERPLYWKATVLDRFDGFAWQRAEPGDPLAEAELAARARLPGPQALAERHPRWVDDATFELRGLRSELAIGSGLPLAVDGVDLPLAAPDGTLSSTAGPLESGDRYTVLFYGPDPGPAEMRRASGVYPPAFAGSTSISLPEGAADLSGAPELAATQASPAIEVPLWGERRGAARRAFLDSPYAETYRLARALTADARTPAGAVRAIEGHLRDGYAYTQNVPDAPYPLASFLFEDRAGYCQQFAGAMALMTRMVGIPSRVVSGFAPGSRDAGTGVYEVRDLDAHSWVEVYLRGLGWVTFDPTPAAAPAASQEVSSAPALAPGRDGALPTRDRSRASEAVGAAGDGRAGVDDQGDAGSVLGLAVLVALGVGAATLAFAYLRRRARLNQGGLAEDQTLELLDAIRRLGWPVGAGSTLLSIERHFEDLSTRRPIAAYARALRASRYSPRGSAPPGGAERRRVAKAAARPAGRAAGRAGARRRARPVSD